MPQKTCPAGARGALSTVRATNLRAQTAWWLAGVASFCLSGAVVLGVIAPSQRYRAELEEACIVPSSSPGTAVFDGSIVISALAAVSDPAATHPSISLESGAAERQPGSAQSLSSEAGIAEPTVAAESYTRPVVRTAFVTPPLPPSRPRDLSARVRLTSMRQPVEFRLADRGSNL